MRDSKIDLLCRTYVDEFCGGPIDNNVYIHTIIIGLACIPTSFWLPLCVHRLGAKFFLGNTLAFNFNLFHHFLYIYDTFFFFFQQYLV